MQQALIGIKHYKKKKKNHRKQMWPIVQCIVKVNEQIQTLLR